MSNLKGSRVDEILGSLESQSVSMIEDEKYNDYEEWNKRHNEILDTTKSALLTLLLEQIPKKMHCDCGCNDEYKCDPMGVYNQAISDCIAKVKECLK